MLFSFYVLVLLLIVICKAFNFLHYSIKKGGLEILNFNTASDFSNDSYYIKVEEHFFTEKVA